jgi:[NiFe] hydrogenase diaphorase moiety large subunit
MSGNVKNIISSITKKYGNDQTRMMDIVRDVQAELHCIDGDAMEQIAAAVGSHRVEVESVVSFYAFLSKKPRGAIVIRLCSDIIDKMNGSDQVAAALEQELGIKFGQTTPDGRITLEYTPCIGMCDQAPAALINDVVVTRLSGDKVREMVRELKHGEPAKLVKEFGDGNNAHELVRAMVVNNIREKGAVIFADIVDGVALKNALGLTPIEVIRALKTARLRGRGGAGFPTGMKWEFTRGAGGEQKIVICNADEGEPGTFKDRVLLTERADLVFEGMAVAGYAIGAESGILYLRGEYAYLHPLLEQVLSQRRAAGLLGKNICGKGFNFDIRIQLGAGAYICGEETALISSCEGLRGDPKTRPPFPAQKGYLAHPTVVNNVETFCCAARIMDKGAGWFNQIGNGKSSGTKLLSISGDCRKPGIYEIPFGTPLKEILAKAGAPDAAAVQVGGPSGVLVGPEDFGRCICFEDLATGGSVMIFGPGRNLLQVVHAFMDFFVEESCGFCTPCRVGNLLLKQRLENIMQGKGEASDLDYLSSLCQTIKQTSRCGLGQTSPNPIASALKSFRPCFEALLQKDTHGLQPSFDLKAALKAAEEIAGRPSVHV